MSSKRGPRAPAALAAYVLHHYDWSESSLILDLFTRDLGRLAVVAKGAKRPYSQFRAVLLPFQRIHVALGAAPKSAVSNESASEVHPLRAAEWGGGHAMLTGNALFSGYYLNELLIKLLARQDPHPALFDVYAATLPALAHTDDAVAQAALRAFELSLLLHLGVLPDLSVLTQTQQLVQSEAHYALLPEVGVTTLRTGQAALPGATLIGLQAALQHGSVPALQQACAVALPEVRQALRGLLHYHLGSNILRTRQVMRGVQHLDR